MTARNLLHKRRVDEFAQWMTDEDIPWREGRGEYEILQVQLPNGGWACLYRRENMPEHVTVDKRLVELVHAFLSQTKRPQPQSQPETSIDTFDVTKPPWE